MDFSKNIFYNDRIFLRNIFQKKKILLAWLFFWGITTAPVTADEFVAPQGGEKRVFSITGYYSPLPWQSKYAMGSYEADIRMNGKGTNGADGTEVYPGMLAAPYTYPFGTKIFIPGLGVGVVHDRGGAIVSAGQRNQSYDRIDVWMGSGEEGLKKALGWGIRVVEGVLYFPETLVKESFSFSDIPLATSVSASSSVFLKDLQKGESGDAVITLQKNLATLGYYSGETTGKYDDATEKAVLDFQLDNNIISAENAQGAGQFGPKTRGIFVNVLNDFQKKRLSFSSHLSRFFPAGMSNGSEGESVAHLQRSLVHFGFDSGSRGTHFDENVEKAVREFQIAHGIIRSETDYGSGVFGPKTQKKVFEIFSGRENTLREPSKSGVVIAEFASEIPADTASIDHIPEKTLDVSAPSVLTKVFPESPKNMSGNAVAGSISSGNEMFVATFGVQGE